MLDEPRLVSLGTFPELSEADAELASILRERLKLLDRKVISNLEWREHWANQQRVAAELESLYGEWVRTASGAGQSAAAARQATARDWASLAADKVSNQDAYLVSIKTERDSVEERLENTRESAEGQSAKQPPPAPSFGATPFEKRNAHIAELRFRQDFQSERRAVANLELKLVRQQAESGVILQRALKRDVALAHEEYRIAKAQLLSSDVKWSNRWTLIAKTADAKAKKVKQEFDLSGVRQHSIEFEVSLAESKTAYREQKHGDIERERMEAEAISGWLKTVLATAQQQAPRVLGALVLIFLAGGSHYG
ncbi:MAG: hypothetical protein VCB43_16280 [Myxococcota bacterium]